MAGPQATAGSPWRTSATACWSWRRASACPTVRARPERSSGLSVPHSKSARVGAAGASRPAAAVRGPPSRAVAAETVEAQYRRLARAKRAKDGAGAKGPKRARSPPGASPTARGRKARARAAAEAAATEVD